MTGEQTERLITVLERIAAAMEKQDTPVTNHVTIQAPADFTAGELATVVQRAVRHGPTADELLGHFR